MKITAFPGTTLSSSVKEEKKGRDRDPRKLPLLLSLFYYLFRARAITQEFPDYPETSHPTEKANPDFRS